MQARTRKKAKRVHGSAIKQGLVQKGNYRTVVLLLHTYRYNLCKYAYVPTVAAKKIAQQRETTTDF